MSALTLRSAPQRPAALTLRSAAILASPALYLKLATENGDENAAGHQAVFRQQWLSAFTWSVGAGISGLVAAYLFGRLYAGEVGKAKFMICAGTWLGAWATWFALASAVDTYDRDGRLDTALRELHFKLLFAAGLMLTLVGSAW